MSRPIPVVHFTCHTSDPQITHAIIITDSMNLLQKVESAMDCPDWHTSMHRLWLQRLLWIYCPGHAGVTGNEQSDRLASTADITSGVQLGRVEVLRGLRNFLNMDRPEHHRTDSLMERGVETFHPPRSRTICVQPGKYWHCFKGNFGETAQRQGGVRMGLSKCYDAILSSNWNWNWNMPHQPYSAELWEPCSMKTFTWTHSKEMGVSLLYNVYQ